MLLIIGNPTVNDVADIPCMEKITHTCWVPCPCRWGISSFHSVLTPRNPMKLSQKNAPWCLAHWQRSKQWSLLLDTWVIFCDKILQFSLPRLCNKSHSLNQKAVCDITNVQISLFLCEEKKLGSSYNFFFFFLHTKPLFMLTKIIFLIDN